MFDLTTQLDSAEAHPSKWLDDERRLAAIGLRPDEQKRLGQYFTPWPIAQTMAQMLAVPNGPYRLLDPGAGNGMLSASAILSLYERSRSSTSVHIVAYEIDESLAATLRRTLTRCARWASPRLNVSFEIHEGDFLTLAQESRQADSMLPREDEAMFDGVLLNPPYGKLGSESVARRGMRDLGVETPNVYAAFWAAAVALTRDGGDVVALTPRSFCNGTYYRDFRRFLLERAAIKQMHVYDSRDRAFSDDGVLQENLITHVVVGAGPQDVRVTAQSAPGTPARSRMVPYRTVVRPEDSDRLISVVPDADMDRTAGQVESFKCSIRDLGLKVSTGPVVDFRSRELIGDGVRGGAVPLIYPTNIRDGRVVWPVINKQASIEEAQAKLRRLLIPDGHYVLVKRFTAKEEPRRVVAGLLRPGGSMAAGVGIENHLNYFHEHGSPLNEHVAIGLTAYLNSSGVDAYLRRFSGHTQVNAGDLRAIPYPSLSVLTHVGARADLARLAEPTYFETLRSSPRPEQSSTLRNLG